MQASFSFKTVVEQMWQLSKLKKKIKKSYLQAPKMPLINGISVHSKVQSLVNFKG